MAPDNYLGEDEEEEEEEGNDGTLVFKNDSEESSAVDEPTADSMVAEELSLTPEEEGVAIEDEDEILEKIRAENKNQFSAETKEEKTAPKSPDNAPKSPDKPTAKPTKNSPAFEDDDEMFFSK
jgi:hypothetical protein